MPTLIPLTLHLCTGEVPPFVTVALNATVLPVQEGLADATITVDRGRFGFTVIKIVLDVAGFVDAQFKLEVTTQVT